MNVQALSDQVLLNHYLSGDQVPYQAHRTPQPPCAGLHQYDGQRP